MQVEILISDTGCSIGSLAPGDSLSKVIELYSPLDRFLRGASEFYGARENSFQACVRRGVVCFVELFEPNSAVYEGVDLIGTSEKAIAKLFGTSGAVRFSGCTNIVYLEKGLGFDFRRGRVSSVFCFMRGYYDGLPSAAYWS